MKVRDFIKREIDIDVYDDVCEELGIAFCGPAELTPEGEEKFAEVLDYDIEIVNEGWAMWQNAIVHVDGENWRHKLHVAKEFFDSLAGFCPCDDYDRWFKEVG